MIGDHLISAAVGAIVSAVTAAIISALLTWRDRRWQGEAARTINGISDAVKVLRQNMREVRDRDALIDRLTRSLNESRSESLVAKINLAETEVEAQHRREDEANRFVVHRAPPSIPGLIVTEDWQSTQPQHDRT